MTRRFIPWVVFVVFLAYLAGEAVRPPVRSGDGVNLEAFRRLPVKANGRVLPFDSVARLALLRIRGSETVPRDGGWVTPWAATSIEAAEWLMEVLAKPDAADGRKIFRIENRELVARLSLVPAGRGTAYFAFRDLAKKVDEIGAHTARIAKLNETERAGWERELLTLQRNLVLYERLKDSVQPNSLLQREAKGLPIAFDFAEELARYRTDLAEAVKVADRRRRGAAETLDPAAEQRLRAFDRRFQVVTRTSLLAVIPPLRSPQSRGQWSSTGEAIDASARGGPLSPVVPVFAAMTSAFAHGKADAFNAAAVRYRRWLAASGRATETSRAGAEVFYNVFQPLVRAIAVYAVALILLGIAWRWSSTTAYRSATLLVLLAFAVQTTGLLLALRLGARPSFVAFAGWAAPLAALVGARFWRRGIGVSVAAASALVALGTVQGFAPGGAGKLIGNMFDIGLLISVAATVVVLGLTAVRGGLRPRRLTDSPMIRHRWRRSAEPPRPSTAPPRHNRPGTVRPSSPSRVLRPSGDRSMVGPQ